MAAGSTARVLEHQVIHFLRKTVTYSDNGDQLTVGTLPAGATILKALSGINVDTAFNAGTTNTINVGTSADDNLYGTALAAGSIAFVALDEAVAMTVSSDTVMTASVALAGTAATAGQAEVIIAYVPDIDG